MAIYHFSVKPVSRSAGRTATAAAAYRAGCKLADDRTGGLYDYTRKRGVVSADIVLPAGAPAWAADRSALWNAAELAEKRKDACVAREYEVALPAELSQADRRRLALEFAHDIAEREGCAVDVAIHAPGRGSDNRNYHAHILRTTRKIEAHGLSDKLDTEKAGRKRSEDLEAVRERWADFINAALERAGHSARVDHRSNAERGIEDIPSTHFGPAAVGLERRTGAFSKRRKQHARLHEIKQRMTSSAELLAEHVAAIESTLDTHRQALASGSIADARDADLSMKALRYVIDPHGARAADAAREAADAAREAAAKAKQRHEAAVAAERARIVAEYRASQERSAASAAGDRQAAEFVKYRQQEQAQAQKIECDNSPGMSL